MRTLVPEVGVRGKDKLHTTVSHLSLPLISAYGTQILIYKHIRTYTYGTYAYRGYSAKRALSAMRKHGG